MLVPRGQCPPIILREAIAGLTVVPIYFSFHSCTSYLCSMAMLIFFKKNIKRRTKNIFRSQKVPKVHDPQTSRTFQTPFFSVVTYEQKMADYLSVCDMFVSCDSTGDRREPVYTSFEKNKETTSSMSTILRPQRLSKLQIFAKRHMNLKSSQCFFKR